MSEVTPWFIDLPDGRYALYVKGDVRNGAKVLTQRVKEGARNVADGVFAPTYYVVEAAQGLNT